VTIHQKQNSIYLSEPFTAFIIGCFVSPFMPTAEEINSR